MLGSCKDKKLTDTQYGVLRAYTNTQKQIQIEIPRVRSICDGTHPFGIPSITRQANRVPGRVIGPCVIAR